MSRVCFVFTLLLIALPARADSLRDLEAARMEALEGWSRIKAELQSLEGKLDKRRQERAKQSQRVSEIRRELDESSWAWRAIRQSRLEEARQTLRTLADEVAKVERELDQGRALEQARRLRLIGAIRAYTDRLFEVAERALSLTPPRKEQADTMVQKALADLPLLEDLEQSKWVKRAIPPLPSLAQESAGRTATQLRHLSVFYRELSDEAQREERKLLPEHSRLSQRLQRLDRLAKRGIADERLPVLIERTREALGRADDVVSSFRGRAESYRARAQELEALAAELALGEGRAPGAPR
ncbi:MAG: hypothetical protein KDD82_12560 [Planctomycetes bacterium]|nr:hypothetical protein [Planctomycetota bacterium]